MQTGQTRTHLARQYGIIGPDSHVVAPLVGWTNTPGIVLIAPAIGGATSPGSGGAGFVQYLAEIEAGSTAGTVPAGQQRFIYVLEGSAQLGDQTLEQGAYAWLPPMCEIVFRGTGQARAWVHEQPYTPHASLATPNMFVGHHKDVEPSAFMDDPALRLAKLLPEDPAYDLEINRFTFDPGAALPLVESHINEHGMVMLEGQGVYRLGSGTEEYWQPVAAGDAVWMGAFCPQWFCCFGKTPATYLYSKNVNRPAF